MTRYRLLAGSLVFLQVLAGLFLIWQAWGLSTWRETDWEEFRTSPDASYNYEMLGAGSNVGLIIVLALWAVGVALYIWTERHSRATLQSQGLLSRLAVLVPLAVLALGWALDLLPPR